MPDKRNAEIDFVVFLLYRISEAWGVPVRTVHERLSHAGILHEYLIPCYDVLHTLGSEYLVEDITELAREKGVRV